MVKTSMVMLVDDGLLRTNTRCNKPALSPILYDDSLKDIMIAIKS